MCNKNSTIFGKKTRSIFVKFTASILPLILFGLFSVSNVSAFSATITVPSTTNLDVAAVGNSASVSSGNVVVDSTCPLGYTVSISGPSDNTLYKDGDNSESNTIPATSGTVANPASILGNNLGTWGYTTTADATINSNFIGLPSSATTFYTKNTGSASGGDNIPITYGVSVPISLIPGDYTLAESSAGAEDDAIVYYLTPASNCTNATVRYNDNGANSPTTMEITHTNVTPGTDVDLIASNYQRPGYGFAGWSIKQLDPDSANFKTELAAAVSRGEVFGPNETITTTNDFYNYAVSEGNTIYVNLYAVWVKAETGTSLQNWLGCGSLNIGEVIALTDLRDNDVYAVARLADGGCWMIENLRLDGTNSDNATGTLAQGYGTYSGMGQYYGRFIGLPDSENADFTNSIIANSIYYSGTQSGNASMDIDTTNNPIYRIPRINTNNTNTSLTASYNGAGSSTYYSWYSYGNYYTWAAAIANTNYYGANNTSVDSTSICPSNWRLPRGGDKNNEANNDFWNLIVDGIIGIDPANYSSSTAPYYTGPTEGVAASRAIRAYPNNFLYSGYFSFPTAYNRGSLGGYWSSTVYNLGTSYSLYLGSGGVEPGTDSNGKSRGNSVRCLMKPGYIITFNANGGSSSMANQFIQEEVATNLSPVEFAAPAIGSSYQNAEGTTIPGQAGKVWSFWGWNTKADGTGDWYKDMEEVTDIASGEIITLYAQWKQADLSDMLTPTSGTKTIVHDTMQDMTAEVCYNSPITTAANAPATTLTDNRDGTTRSYNVSKLADGNCWMTTNLALGTTSAVTLSPEDTDIKSSFTLPAGTTTSSTTATAARIRLTNNSDSTANGVYYSWAAAVASTSSTSATPTTSICPRNWNLPTNQQYLALATASNYSTSNLTTSAPSSFLINNVGFTNGATFYDTDYGHYWTATSYSVSSAYGARLNSSTLTTSYSSDTTYGGYKYYEKNVRCIATQGNTTITYIANDGTGATITQYVNIDSDTLATNMLFPAGDHKQFKSWNTSDDGTGTSYAAGTAIPSLSYPGQSITLYAIWNDIWTMTFVNTATSATRAKVVVQGSTTTAAPSSSWSRSGYKLVGWDTNSTGTDVVYTNNQSITPSSDMTFYTVWKPTYTINYNFNSTDTNLGGNMGITHTNVAGGDQITLYASNFGRAGYGFAGWSFDSTAQPGGSATIYGPNETITAPDALATGTTKTLYAVWVPSAGDFQSWGGCNSMNIGDVTALTDQRDNDTYAVAKLADDICWMIENLRLDYDADFTESLSQGFGKSTTYGNFIGLADPEVANFSSSTTANSIYYSATQSGTASINIYNDGKSYYRFPRYRNDNTNKDTTKNTNVNVTNMTGTAQNIYSYGNYYSWAAAMANTIYYNGPTATDADGKTSEMVGTSICPAGWKLPYGRDTGNGIISGGFYNLGTELGATASSAESSNVWRSFPNNFLYSGATSYSSVSGRSGTGVYWSSTVSTDGSSYGLHLSSSSVGPGTYTIGKYNGQSVRCVAEPTYTISFDANGGTGTMSDLAGYEDLALTLTANSFTAPSGKTFIGWNTAADGSGIMYSDLESVKNLTTVNSSITLYARWECGQYYICYDQNGANSPTKMGREISGGSGVGLFASNFQRPGYGFAGWNTEPDGSGTSYGPNDRISGSIMNIVNTTGLVLYAMWVPSAGNLQNWNGCSSLNVGDVTALTDLRDNDTYAVAKLADENCWMIENLRLDYDADFTESLSQGFGKSTTFGNFIGLAEPETANFSNTTTANSIYFSGTQSGTASIDIGTTDYPGYRVPRYRNDNTASPVANTVYVDSNIYSYGNYYTWSAALANTINYSTATSTDANNKTSETVNTSICPAGWRLPYGRDTGNGIVSGGFSYLDSKLGGTGGTQTDYEASLRWRAYPNNFIFAGETINSSIDSERGYSGFYWASTNNSNSGAWYLLFRDSYIYPGTINNPKSTGFSVRCLLGN